MHETDGRCEQLFNISYKGLRLHTDDSASQHVTCVSVASEHVSTPISVPALEPMLSFRLVGDNIDKTVRPRHMRVDHQNLSLHYFHVYAVQDRISFQHLSSTPMLVTLEDIDVNKFLPNADDYTTLKNNFKVLMKRILVQHLPALAPIRSSMNQHIIHEFTSDMSRKSSVVI